MVGIRGAELIGLRPIPEGFAFGQFRRNWLAQAEASETGISFTFLDLEEFAEFCRVAGIPEALATTLDLRQRFPLLPRHWVKLRTAGPGYSQYHTLQHGLEYPVTTLRLLVKRLGGDPSRLERALQPALVRPDTVWAVIAKGGRPFVACRVAADLLGALLEALETEPRLAAAHLEWRDRMAEGEPIYVTMDPSGREPPAVDYRRYVKCRLDPVTLEPIWTRYRPLPEVLSPPELDELCAPEAPDLDALRLAYDTDAHAFMEAFGPTYQAACLGGSDRAASNRTMAERAGVQDGMRILDAGCGHGGPAIDLARTWPSLRIEAVTLSPVQAELAASRVAEAGLQDRIRVTCADVHSLPFEDASFDRVLFLESWSYTPKPAGLAQEALRVLRPGGRLYVKDAFTRRGPHTPAERLELAEYDRVYRYRAGSPEELVRVLRAAGFRDVETRCLDSEIRTESYHRGLKRALGARDYRRFLSLPVGFDEVLATRST